MNFDAKIKKENDEYLDWLEDLRDRNDTYFETAKNLIPFYIEFAKTSPHKSTLSALMGFHASLSILKNSIIDLSETDNLYAIKVLYRVYLEQWMKGMYIWDRYGREKNDDVGQEYSSLGRIGELLKYGNSIKAVSELVDAESKGVDVWDNLCKLDPNLKKFNKKEITRNIKKFEYKNIAKYLLDNDTPGGSWVPTIIEEYAELSSFVHGGPSATDQCGQIAKHNEQFKEYKGMVRFSFNTCRVFAYSVFSLMYKDFDDEKKKEILPLLHTLMDKQGLL